MRRVMQAAAVILLGHLLAATGTSQADRLQGSWEGTFKSVQGERPATVDFRKEADSYAGTITGAQGSTPLKDVKVDGDKITAGSEFDSPQAGLMVFSYKLLLQGENLKGEGTVVVAGQTYEFTLELKRAAAGTSAAPRPTRPGVPQPQQKQSLEYFVGEWTFKWGGRESAFGPGGPAEGITTFKLSPDRKMVEGRTEGKAEDGPYQEGSVFDFDEAAKLLSVSERRRGIQLTSKGDWTSPLAIRFTYAPVKVKGHTLQLKRTLRVISGFSFTITDELSEDSGPFSRLGQAVFSKVDATTSNKQAKESVP